MARFAVNRPITTEEPTIVVDAGLPPGRHRFQLVVMSRDRRTSPPDEVVVEIRERGRPPFDPE